MPTNPRILIDLQAALTADQHGFSLLCIYKGVPMDAPLTLLRLEDETVWVKLEAPGPELYLRQKQALLLTEGLLDPLTCDVVQADLERSVAALTNLDFAGRHISKRHELRVEPAEPLALTLKTAGQEIELEIADVSMNGLGAFSSTFQPGPELSSGQAVQTTLHLPSGPLELAGTLRSLSAGASGCRMAIAFSGAEPQREQLLRYIMQRRAEITAEVYPVNV